MGAGTPPGAQYVTKVSAGGLTAAMPAVFIQLLRYFIPLVPLVSLVVLSAHMAHWSCGCTATVQARVRFRVHSVSRIHTRAP